MTSRRTTFLTGALILLAVVGGVGGYAWHRSGAGKTPATASFDASRPATAKEAAQQDFLPPSVFAVQWSEVGDKTAAEAGQLGQPDPCFPEDQDMRSVSKYRADYAFDRQTDAREAGHLTYVVTTAASEDVAQHQISQYASDDFSYCLDNLAQQGLSKYGVPGAVSTTKAKPTFANVPVVQYDAAATVKMADGSNALGHYRLVYLQHGSTVVRMEFFSGNGNLTGPTDEDTLVAEAAKELAAN